MSLDWKGDNPFILQLYRGGEHKIIDLDEKGWKTTYADWFGPDTVVWLTQKLGAGKVPITPIVMTGGTYVCRVTRKIPGDGREVRAYGLLDAEGRGLWVFDADGFNPTVCGDADFKRLADLILDRAW